MLWGASPADYIFVQGPLNVPVPVARPLSADTLNGTFAVITFPDSVAVPVGLMNDSVAVVAIGMVTGTMHIWFAFTSATDDVRLCGRQGLRREPVSRFR